ncbi:outer membrane chaperone Skp (OmpH) [Bacteroides coprosuis DSM 18011]|uniref:Outer membrane chaperone Skp (OmpH) n=1 Tax=Bacteroides coprosuis DSM 18011 TaxID=679937 RepID=F3ZS07_9BACE|nr:OmpH family outer membrane protein [Bacteroides coprosuis]EGJ70813.1 outer membrane chaperone Skp (OmpH) [Bacteroides coprosuis DSM 18011]HJD92430.1 OmpH family outer membrane protein [Bacteroides coprosuis]
MLKKIVLLVMLVLPLGAMAQTLKFGHTNSQELIVDMPEFKKAQESLKALEDKYNDEFKRTQDEFSKKAQQFQQDMSENTLPQNIAERRQKELQDMGQRLEAFQNEAYQSMQKAQMDLMAPITKKVNDAIQKVGKSEGLIYIFDLSSGVIPYIDSAQSKDITTLIKAELK